MMSKKWAFSLTSLITIIALAFVVPSTQAADEPFEIKIIGRSMISYTLAAADDSATPFDDSTQVRVALEIESAQVLPNDYASKIMYYVADEDGIPIDMADATATPAVEGYTVSAADDSAYPNRTGKNRRIYVDITVMTNETPARTVKTVILTIPADAITTPDATVPTTDKKNMNKVVQHTLTLTQAATTAELAKLPKVVSIQRLRPGSQTVVAAFQEERLALDDFPTFDVRIVLTDHPHGIALDKTPDENAKNLLEVQNGVPSNLIVGTKFTRFGGVGDNPDTGTTETDFPIATQTVRPDPGEGHYYFDNTYAPLQDTERISMNMTDTVPLPTSADGTNTMYRQYRVTITPDQKSSNFDVKIRVKSFHDNGSPIRNTYVVRNFDDSPHLPNGRDILTIPVKGAARDLTAGYKVTIPKDIRIPGGGYLVIAQNTGGSEVVVPPGSKKDAPKATERTPAQMIYNVIEHTDLPNLATQFLNGVVVDVESQHAGLVVSEVMWGEDVSLATPTNSQYIELYNPGADYVTIDDKDQTPDINEALTLIFYRPNEFNDVPAAGADGSLPTGITDRIGTLYGTGTYWSPATKGSSGRSGTTAGEERTGRGEVVEPVPIVSMYRVMAADGTIDAMMGQMSASWMSSMGPKSANFDPLAIGIRHGTPGAATDDVVTPAETEAEAKAKADAAAKAAADAAEQTRTTGTIPEAGSIYISEIMFAGGGTLPQWIEIANGSATEDANLSGWTLTIANAAADADVSIGASAKFTIPDGTMIYKSRQINHPSTILVVTEAGRNNIDPVSEQVIVLNAKGSSTEIELIDAGVLTRKYTLLSSDAFLITLAPGAPAKTNVQLLAATATAAEKSAARVQDVKDAAMREDATDKVGNLSADGTAAWALPMSEDGRSSIIRKHVNVRIGPSEPEDGTMAENWALAADTAFADATHIRQKTYYGAMSDEGTPGFRAGGALPVELSHFRPARQKDTGAVVITWATESELNNAGFFIKRSNQRNGEFKVINATMVPGAGTTSEKQFYTYTDTTAQPNVVYYYQIEDVSLDGNRQTLTRGIRLKGHVGAAVKRR